MKLFIEIKNQIHDASGVKNPIQYFWMQENEIYYPIRKIEENEIHELIEDFIIYYNLPQISLDEINLDLFDADNLPMRNFLFQVWECINN